ncbi:MAG: TIGR00730 family Rossman fold protein [Solobacterium sp.]|nr:TIGR00730 family Rossman fold protein [Solobacterium sp.]
MNITVYLGSNEGKDPEFRKRTAELGDWIGKSGHTLVYGGARWGLMGVLADHVTEHGGRVVGVIPHFIADRGVTHPGITLLEYADTMSERKARMLELGDAYIAMPGGPGTLEEIIEAISLARLGQHKKPCMLYDINGYYAELRSVFDKMIAYGFLKEQDMNCVRYVHDLDEVRAVLEEHSGQ